VKYVITVKRKKRKSTKLIFKNEQGVIMSVTLSETAPMQAFKLVALDSKGREVPITTAPVWSNSNPGAVDLILQPNEINGEVRWLDGGISHVTAAVEVKPGKILVSPSLDVTCEAAEAQTLEIQLV
jgi:hypothetical protein